MMAVPAGYTKAVEMPTPRDTKYTSHIWMEPVTTRMASSAMNTAFTARETSSTRRGDMRSTTAPPMSMNTARGSDMAASTRPSAAGLPVSFSTSQGKATRVNWSPKAEMVLPKNSSLKSRLANTEGFLSAMATRLSIYMYVRIHDAHKTKPPVVAFVMPLPGALMAGAWPYWGASTNTRKLFGSTVRWGRSPGFAGGSILRSAVTT